MTTNETKERISESFTTLHLVTPQSSGRPLCGEKDPDAQVGAYAEHLDDKGERRCVVLGKDGTPGEACADCLARYSSTLYLKSMRNEDGWPFFVMLAKWHIGAIAVPLLLWLLWLIAKWLAKAPYPPRIP